MGATMTQPTRQELIDGVLQWTQTGYGIDPNQIAMRHYPGEEDCKCFKCAGTPILTSHAPYTPIGERKFPS